MLFQKKILPHLSVMFLLAVALGCVPAAPPPSIPPTATPTPTPPAATQALIPGGWKMFTSQKYHYSIGYPGDWKVAQAMEMWSGDIPHTDDDRADQFTSPGGRQTGNVTVAAQGVPEGTTLEGWTSTTIQNWGNDAACEPAARESLRVGGEPGTFLVYSPCLAYYILSVTFVHGHAGFLVYWLSNPGSEAKDRATFEQFLSTLAFPN